MRNPVRWKKRNGRIVITHEKNLSPFESFLRKRFGGPRYIRRPLDELGSTVWLLCDGRRDLAEICVIMDEKYKERIEPVFRRVWDLIGTLARSGLMRIEESPRGRLPLRVKRKE